MFWYNLIGTFIFSTEKKNSKAVKLRLSPFNLSRPGHIHNNSLHNIHDKNGSKSCLAHDQADPGKSS